MAKLRHNRLTYYRWEWHDPYHSEFWTACTVSIYAPTYEMPFVSVLVSFANGKGRVFMRTKTLDSLPFGIVLPSEGRERLERALTQAQVILNGINDNLRLVMGAQNLEPGARVIRTDTGEVIRQAEEILGLGEPRSDGSEGVDRGRDGNRMG